MFSYAISVDIVMLPDGTLRVGRFAIGRGLQAPPTVNVD
jgi:hypothetical protein